VIDVERPRIVCLCGSVRFADTFYEANTRETLAGKIVLSVGCLGDRGCPSHTDEEKARLDELHLRKIDLADEVLMLNVGGYLGESSRRELAYAQAQGKDVRWWEPVS
jgi:hypothetical protein